MNLIAKLISCVFVLCFIGISALYPQNGIKTLNDIHLLISHDSLHKARRFITQNIDYYKAHKQYDSLANYIQFEGSYKLNNGNNQIAIAKALELTDYITATGNPLLIKTALTEMGWIYDDAGQTGKAYNLLLQAVEPSLRITEPKNTDAASIQYSLGYYTTKIGNYPLSKQHYLTSLVLLKKSKAEDYVFYNQIYNSLGGLLWQQTKLDSANYYFQQAIEMLKKTDSTNIKNKYYRPSLIKMNMSIIQNALGKNKEAIALSYEAIENLQKYIELSIDELLIKSAKGNIFTTLDNLASYHNTLGEFKRSEEIMEYSYTQKQKVFEENDIIIIISHIILAEAKTNSRNFKAAAYHADRAIELLKNHAGEDLYWKAGALSTRGVIYEKSGNMELARRFYEMGDQVYRSSLNDTYSKEFLDHLIELSNFYIKIKEDKKAILTAKEGHNYVHKGTLKNTLQEFYHTQNLADVFYKLKNYKEAIRFSEEAIQFNITSNGNKLNATDSILIQYRKPRAFLINTASKYYLFPNKSQEILKQYLKQIETAISILEQRKKVVNTHEDVTILINENEDLFNFAKKLRLELYELSKDEIYLDQVISLHESAIYNRIRSRLNLR
jgi:tetratricopeptide (TPR) repeat protein